MGAKPHVVIGILLLGLLPFLAHFFYIVPDYDDFCIAISARMFGFWENLWQFYLNWTGRLASIGLVSVPLFVADLVGGSFVVPYQLWAFVLFLSMFAIVLGVCITNFLHFNVIQCILLSLIFILAIVFMAPVPRDLFFYITTVAVYTVPGVIYFVVVSIVANVAFKNWRFRPTSIGLICLLCAFLALFNEYTGLSVVLVCLLALAVVLLREKSLSSKVWHLGLFAASSFLASLVLLLAPGNQRRMSFAEQPDLVSAAAKAVLFWFDYVNTSFVSLVLVLFCLLFALALFSWSGEQSNAVRSPGDSLLGGATHVVSWVLISGLAFAAGAYATGKPVPERVHNQLQIVGVLAAGFFVASLIEAGAAVYSKEAKDFMSKHRTGLRLAFAALLLCFLANPTLLKAVANLAGETQLVYRENMARFELIEGGPDDVLVPPNTAWSELNSTFQLASAEDTAPGSHQINECYAGYFGKRSILLER